MTNRYADIDENLPSFLSTKLEGGAEMRHAIWLPAGEIVAVRHFDSGNNRVLIEHHDGRCETVDASTIHLLNYPVYSETTV
jgi:hypothetical protein